MKAMTTWCMVAVSGGLFPGSGFAQSTTLASQSSAGVQGTQTSYVDAISANGRYVLFTSSSWTLVVGDTNASPDVFVRDLQLGTTDLVSVTSTGAQCNQSSAGGATSADGRFMAFWSYATNVVPGGTSGNGDVFLRDRLSGTWEVASLSWSGAAGDGPSTSSSISDDGRYVAFLSAATNLVPNDTNGYQDVFVRDRLGGTTELVSQSTTGVQGSAYSYGPAISADGRYVVFYSLARTLVPNDTNGTWDVFVRDRQAGTTELVSQSTTGVQGNNLSYGRSISADGRYVPFDSASSNLVPGVGGHQVYVRDLQNGTTELLLQGNGISEEASISSNGRYVSFKSSASNLVTGDTNGLPDVFVHDRVAGATTRASVSSGGTQANGGSMTPWISGDGSFVAFQSGATNLVSSDMNGWDDVFVRDSGAPPPQAYCTAGSAGVIACPCVNPPAGADRGCDNSAGTGGATITATGTASLATDTLVFYTGAEKPTATSIVLQGTTSSATGLVFGQGVRCVAGILKRLYVKTASGGSITAPSGADPSVSARSAALGNPISAGEHRYYMVYYRDPIVLGGCPATSTFNATDALDVQWAH